MKDTSTWQNRGSNNSYPILGYNVETREKFSTTILKPLNYPTITQVMFCTGKNISRKKARRGI
jgi:hypothetical protein